MVDDSLKKYYIQILDKAKKIFMIVEFTFMTLRGDTHVFKN